MTKDNKLSNKDLQQIVNGGISELLEERFAVQLELEKRKARADERKKVLEEIEKEVKDIQDAHRRWQAVERQIEYATGGYEACEDIIEKLKSKLK